MQGVAEYMPPNHAACEPACPRIQHGIILLVLHHAVAQQADELVSADSSRRAAIAAFENLRAEQKELGKLVRPSAIYVGPAPRSPESVQGWDEIKHSPV